MAKIPAVYIMCSKKNGALYTGVTAHLIQRVFSHKEGLIDGFTKKYNCKILVYYEFLPDMPSAIKREKSIKGISRNRKIALIESLNPQWDDLFSLLTD